MTEAVSTAKMLVIFYQTTRRNIPKDILLSLRDMINCKEQRNCINDSISLLSSTGTSLYSSNVTLSFFYLCSRTFRSFARDNLDTDEKQRNDWLVSTVTLSSCLLYTKYINRSIWLAREGSFVSWWSFTIEGFWISWDNICHHVIIHPWPTMHLYCSAT